MPKRNIGWSWNRSIDFLLEKLSCWLSKWLCNRVCTPTSIAEVFPLLHILPSMTWHCVTEFNLWPIVCARIFSWFEPIKDSWLLPKFACVHVYQPCTISLIFSTTSGSYNLFCFLFWMYCCDFKGEVWQIPNLELDNSKVLPSFTISSFGFCIIYHLL